MNLIDDAINAGEDFKSLYDLKGQKYSKYFKKSKKPIFIIGQGALTSDEGEELFYYLLDVYNKSTPDSNWTGFNILQNFSGRVGSTRSKILQPEKWLIKI